MNKIFEVLLYLENHINWLIKVEYYEKKDTSFIKKCEELFLDDVMPDGSIIALSDAGTTKLNFVGDNYLIKTLDVSCQEGFFIRIYEDSNLDKLISNHELSVNNSKANFSSLYANYCLETKKSNKVYFEELIDKKTLFSRNSKVYLFSNEPLSRCLSENNISFKDKCIFSIAGSGDFFLDACVLGCRDITLVDINRYSYYYFQIKNAIIKKYNYDDFFKMYHDLINIYNKFDDYKLFIPKEVVTSIVNDFSPYFGDVPSFLLNVFWSDSYEFNSEINVMRRERSLKKRNLYLNKSDNYNKLRKILLNEKIDYNYFNSSIFDLDFKQLKKYDYIYLSNICDYYDSNEFCDFLLSMRDTILKPYGKIILFYRTDKYKELLINSAIKITQFDYGFDGSLYNMIIFCSFD